jgi:cellulose synthase/poly-beta-1,6-N-acetylglucosamine synthase-like glycosyltransferase
MGIISIVFVVILFIYTAFIAQLIWGFKKVNYFKVTDSQPKTAFTIIVPFRNEEKDLPKLLASLSQLHYPKHLIQFVLVDDFSNDNSVRVYNQWRMAHESYDTTLLENLHLSYSPKKDALTRAIPIAKHDWIVTTDADCIVNPNWLLTLDNYIQTNQPEMVVGAVIYKTKNNWFHYFQQLDLLSLQGTTIGSFGINKPFMCNGANFAYTKNFFTKIGGFGGINDKASGDDVLLLQKAVSVNLEKVHYLINNHFIVTTKPENDLFKLFMQRVRWASKTSSYSSTYAKFLAVMVLLMNISLVCGLWFVVCGCYNWKILLVPFLIKYLVDYCLLYKANTYLLKGKWLLPLASSFIYPFYSSLVGIYSLFGSFSWKGRVFKK